MEHFECPDCGSHVAADEDGCCSTCGADTAVTKCNCLSDGAISRMIGPCPDIEQRIKDLYIVNNVASWAKNQLRILAEMAIEDAMLLAGTGTGATE